MKSAKVFSVFVVLLLGLTASAQITLTQGSFVTAGSHDVGEAIGPVTFNVGPSGANQTWTFGDYTWDYTMHEELVDAASSPYFASFPASNRVVHITGGDAPAGGIYAYYRMAADGLYFLGTGTSVMVVAATSEARMVTFPCTYQTTWTSVLKYSMMGASTTDSSINTVDGWGNLTTPYGTRETLRWFSHTWNIIVIPFFPPTTTEYLSYSWLSAQGEELLLINSETDVTDPNFTTGSVEMSHSQVAVDPERGPLAQSFSVGQNYPNPFNPTTVLPVELAHHGHVTLDIYDETGRLVSSQNYELAAGHHALAVNGSQWATGTYFAKIISAAQSRTVKMLLVK